MRLIDITEQASARVLYNSVKVVQGDREFTIESCSVVNEHIVLRLKEDGFDPNPTTWVPRNTCNLKETYAI